MIHTIKRWLAMIGKSHATTGPRPFVVEERISQWRPARRSYHEGPRS